MSQPWFVAVERFGPANGKAWLKYIEWSGLKQLEGLVSLDSMLCPVVLQFIRDEDWRHIVQANGFEDYFTELPALHNALAVADVKDAQILCVFRNPDDQPLLPEYLGAFRFLGFDLVDAASGVSALTNCGGWPELDNSELSEFGLIETHSRAAQLQRLLCRNHPEEPHAACDVWAIFAAPGK